ncbi:hypothetical protein QNI19_05895 [Cytophagaceae bacterium DM2B3-1]|uniref:Uncharacterized protein n=1 Tax=Xanthocytophaga flava TaxID=3048013 RepID=A0ABT7CFG0_9BACT|nr:hypothetical protein [Xanthocytophaga flavus]
MEDNGIDKILNRVYPRLNPEKIPSQNALDRKIIYYQQFMPEDTSFHSMIPLYVGDHPPEEIHAICDLHGWIKDIPAGLMYPVSKQFKELLEQFAIPNTKFYEGSVLWNEKEYPYFVWHLLTEKYQQNIDFGKSSFGNYNFIRHKWMSDDEIIVEDYIDLIEKKEALDWRDWGFRRAVMKPEFRDIDAISIHRYGIVISERLKEAIESAQLTNVSITPCPIEFEISDQI